MSNLENYSGYETAAGRVVQAKLLFEHNGVVLCYGKRLFLINLRLGYTISTGDPKAYPEQ